MIDETRVRLVARLAKLLLSDEEVRLMTTQLGAILEYIDQLNRLDTTDIPPAAHALPLQNVLRPDRVVPGLAPAEALATAPQREGDYVRVPKIL